MGQDAEQSHRGWRRHLRGVSRARAAKSSGDAERGTLFFSARELGTIAINLLEWSLYVVLTWGLIALVLSDQMPKLVQSREPIYWLGAPRSEPRSGPPSCIAVVEDLAPTQDAQEMSSEFKRGFEAAIQVMITRLERGK